jgi:hypothetical protein
MFSAGACVLSGKAARPALVPGNRSRNIELNAKCFRRGWHERDFGDPNTPRLKRILLGFPPQSESTISNIDAGSFHFAAGAGAMSRSDDFCFNHSNSILQLTKALRVNDGRSSLLSRYVGAAYIVLVWTLVRLARRNSPRAGRRKRSDQ